MNLISALILFVIQFEGYYWDPCSFTGRTGTCYAIDGYEASQETIVCTTVDCVNEIINKRGIEHLEGVYKIDFDSFSLQEGSKATLKKMQVKHKLVVDEEAK